MGWVINATPRPFYSQERPGTHCIGGWVFPRAGLNRCGKSRPHRDSIPGPSSPWRVAIPTELSWPTYTLGCHYNSSHTLQAQSKSGSGSVPLSLTILCLITQRAKKILLSHCINTCKDRESILGVHSGAAVERDHLGDPIVDGRIRLRWIFRKWDGGVWTGLNWLRIETGDGHLWTR
jgi:hypothetical protein